MKNFLAVIGGIVVGFFVLMVVVYVSNTMNMDGVAPFSAGSPVSRVSSRSMTAEEIARRIDDSMEKTMPGLWRSELDLENELYKVDLWSEFTPEQVSLMQSGYGLDSWTEMRKQMLDLCADLQGRFSDNGHPEITVVLSLMGLDDSGEPLATAARGTIGYDVVSGIDLLNDAKEDADGS